MAGSEITLMPGEQMVIDSHPHWWFFWKQTLECLGVVVLAFLYFSFDGALGTMFGWLTVLALIGWAGDTIYQLLQWRTCRFAVTTERVAYQSGFFRRKGVSIPLNRINNVNFEQSFIARLLGNGTLTIESASETGDSVFENIPEPEHVRSVIFSQIDARKSTDAQRGADAVAAAMQSSTPSGAPNVGERLQELDRLRDQGLLTDAEYAERRQAILGDL